MSKILFLVPDTNFFIQCKEPQALSWQEFSTYERVELIITRPVQAELDSHKGKGNGRVSKRARKASSIIKSLLISGDESLNVRASAPSVIMRIRQDVKPDAALDCELMYVERDDQLVGIASTISKAYPAVNVKIMTHDIGPIASAKTVGVEFFSIPDDWLLPPETDESEKQVSALQAELKKYKQNEPEFDFLVKVDEAIVQKIDLSVSYYDQASDAEVEQLIGLLRSYCPETEDFGPLEAPKQMRAPGGGAIFEVGGAFEVFRPATQRDIDGYKIKYKKWIDESRVFFKQIHNHLNRPSALSVVSVGLKNTGFLPSDDNLISFSCRGDFFLQPTDSSQDENEVEDFSLPAPPVAPKGSMKDMSNWLGASLFSSSIGDMLSLQNGHFRMPEILRHDPNAFYWKPSRPDSPVSKVSLECDQWRHQVDWEWFCFHLHAPHIAGKYSGVLEVELHAKNILNKIEKRYYVSLDVDVRSSVSAAESLIHSLFSAQ